MTRIAYLIAGLAMGALPLPCNAATFLITYEGSVTSGSDVTGVFGLSGSNLSGSTYKIVYTLVTTLPGTLTFDDGTFARISGGSSLYRPSPLSATITINNVTATINGTRLGLVDQFNDYTGADSMYHEVQSDILVGYNYSYNFMYNYLISARNDFLKSQDYTAPLDYTLQDGDTSSGNFQMSEYEGGRAVREAFGQLSTTRVTVSPAAAIPEPTTWLTTILGFAAIGLGMRRKQHQSVRYRIARHAG